MSPLCYTVDTLPLFVTLYRNCVFSAGCGMVFPGRGRPEDGAGKAFPAGDSEGHARVSRSVEARAGVGVGGCGRGNDTNLRLVVNLWVLFEDLAWSAGLQNLWRMFRSFGRK